MATQDKLRLDGLLFEPDSGSKIGIMHLHGRAGNFCANTFFGAMANVYTEAGFGFLTVNLRGHDHIADFRVGKTEQLKRIGAAFDIFEDCAIDIAAWLDFFRSKGYEKIILQGHSQGGAKAVYFLNEETRNDVVALVLISPADAVGLLKKHSKEIFERDLAEAKNLLAQGKGEEFLSCKVRDWYYVSAKTFINEFGENTAANIFPIAHSDDFIKLKNIKKPIPDFYGSEEDITINSPEIDLGIIAKNLVNKKSETFIIDGANHTYLGFEDQAANSVAKWIKEII